MRTRTFGPTGHQVSVLGQGTWRLARPAQAAAALEHGIGLGLTHIDTAELYEQQSRSETLLGDLLSKPDPQQPGATLRQRVFLASKVLPSNASRKGTVSACKDSLVRLQADHLDLYYLHWRGPHPLADTMAAMGDLVDRGWVASVGVSNFDVDDLEEAKSALGARRLAANQVLYHLEDRGAEAEVLPWCRANGVALVAYSPFGAGRIVTERKRLGVLESVAKECGLTPRQAALAFLARDSSVFVIPKAESIAHVSDNAGGDVELPRHAIERLEEAFPLRPGLRHI